MKKSKFLFSLALLAATMGFNFKAGALGRQVVGPNSESLMNDYVAHRCGFIIIDRGGVEHFYLPNGRIVSHAEAFNCCRRAFKFHNVRRGARLITFYLRRYVCDTGFIDDGLRRAFICEISKRLNLEAPLCAQSSLMDWYYFVYEHLTEFRSFLFGNTDEARDIFMKLAAEYEKRQSQTPRTITTYI